MKKILSLLLAVCMVFTLPSLSVLAAAADALSGANGEITAFAELTETEKTVLLGTAKADLNLLQTLTATVRAVVNSGSTEETTVSVPVTWVSSPEYDTGTAGIYVFTPEIKGYTVSANLPEITVTVGNVPNMLMLLGTGSTTNVDTEAALRAAVGTGGTGDTVALTADITGVTTQLDIARDVTLDLNGHSLTIDLPATFGHYSNGIKIAGEKTFTVTDSNQGTNKLTVKNEATGGNTGTGAAINTSDGTIIIESGTVEATGGSFGAGIGGGDFDDDGGTIIINGSAQVTANGGLQSAGIGGGNCGAGGNITISGSAQVTATGNNGGAGIGGGMGVMMMGGGGAGTIAISGGTVKATGSVSGEGIGTGSMGNGGTVTITGGSIQTGSITPPTNGSNANGYKTTLTVPGAGDGTTVSHLTVPKAAGADYAYGTDGIITVDTNKVYVYLPAGAAELTYGGKTYTATVTTDGAAEFEAPITTPETTPKAVFTATGEHTGTLTNIASGMKYSVDGGTNWTAVAEVSADITGVSAANGVKVKKPGNGTTTTDSAIQDIAVTKGGAVAGITAVGCTTNSNNDGKLKGITTAMEYKLSSVSAWTPGTGSNITGLANGTYDVRVKASGSMLAGDSSAFPVAAFVPTIVAKIASFGFASPSAAGTVDNTSNTVSVTVPYGTDVTALTPVITLTDVGASVSPAGVQNFTSPVDYTVTSGNGATNIYTVTVSIAPRTGGNSNSPSTPSTTKAGTETRVDKTNNDATVTTVPDGVMTNGDTTNIDTTVPSITLDNTLTSTKGDTVDITKKTNVTINVPTGDIKQQLNAKKNVELTITVPSEVTKDTNANLAVTINANKDILGAAKANASDVTIKIKDADTQQMAYSWTFRGADLAKSTTPMTDVNIAMSVHLTTEVSKINVITPANKGLVLSFDHSGVLPSVASVKISALDKGFKPGQTLYFYYYNPTSKQIEPLSTGAYAVDADGYVTVQIYHCSDYVLLPNVARSLTLDTKSYIMPLKGKYEIGISMVNAKDTTVKVYSSTPGMVTVTKLKNGNYQVTGLKAGLTYIMFDVYDEKGKLIAKSHASVRLIVKSGVKPSGDSWRQTAIF